MEKWLRACLKNPLPLLLHPERFRGRRRGLGSTAIELGDLSKEFAVLSPSPPLEERAGERRPFNAASTNSMVLGPGRGGRLYPNFCLSVLVRWQPSFVTVLWLEFPLLLWRRGLGRGGRLYRNLFVTILVASDLAPCAPARRLTQRLRLDPTRQEPEQIRQTIKVDQKFGVM